MCRWAAQEKLMELEKRLIDLEAGKSRSRLSSSDHETDTFHGSVMNENKIRSGGGAFEATGSSTENLAYSTGVTNGTDVSQPIEIPTRAIHVPTDGLPSIKVGVDPLSETLPAHIFQGSSSTGFASSAI